MKIYNAIFFWLGGVLTETVSERTAAELIPGMKGHEGIHLRQQLRGLAEALAVGAMTPMDYCEQAVALCRSPLAAAELKRRIIEATTLHQTLAELIAKIPEPYECWLVADYPPDWYTELAAHGQLAALFPRQRIVVTSELGLLKITPDIFYRLPQAARKPMDACLAVDALSARAVAAMKHGLATIFYVYPERLKLELALQGIWQTDADVMHPTSSERVKFA
jgi:FMN phosphatase YigB (HAD superfamily)